MQKLKGTYIDALPQLVNPRDRPRAHVASTRPWPRPGRLSSSDPEPAEHPDPHRARPRDPARVHRRARLRADLGRLLADRAAGARAPVRRRGAHRRVPARRGHPRPDGAGKVFGADSGLDPHELRRRAKIINYALLYGKTAFTLAKDIGVTQQAAQAFIDAYFAGFPARARVHRPDARGRRARPAW